MPRQGKCTNYAGCLLAYRHETLHIGDSDDFVCPECHQPLTPAAMPAIASPKLIPALILGGITGLVLIGAIAVFTQAKRLRRDDTAPLPPPAATAATNAPVPGQGGGLPASSPSPSPQAKPR